MERARGRPQGSVNKVAKEIRESLALLLSKRVGKLEQRLDECEAKDELNIIVKLLEFAVPKLSPIPADVEDPKKSEQEVFVDSLLEQVEGAAIKADF